MSFYLELCKATEIVRDEEGFPYSWRQGEKIKVFRNGGEFQTYVLENIESLKDAVCFTGSASLLVQANRWLVNEQKLAGVL